MKAKSRYHDGGALQSFVASGRLFCAKNGEFEKMKAGSGSAIAYAWFVWQKGYTGDPVVKWIN